MSKVHRKSKSFYDTYDRKAGIQDVTHYCPGCGHGVLHKLIAEALDDFEITDRTTLISPVGCSVFAYYYFKTGNIQCAHGRAPAVATGIKRVNPHSIVISYQGDGDLAAIGGNNILQAANRGENITVFFVNNAIYGMTGGQMAPTTLVGQKTTTSPTGRSLSNEGYPMRVSELISTLDAPVYVERVALTDAKHTNIARKAVRKALTNQIENKGFSLVEVLSVCPSGWKMDPVQSKEWLTEHMMKIFPLGVYKDRSDDVLASASHKTAFNADDLYNKLEIPTDIKDADAMPQVEQKYANPGCLLAGFGGQGVLMLGYAMAQAGMKAGYSVSWIPSYGPEMRGGTANCSVNLSTERIGSPLVTKPTVLVAMNLPSLDKFEPMVEKDGVILYDSEMIPREVKRTDVNAVAVPATKMADEMGNTRVANMIMLGAYLELTGVLQRQTVIDALPSFIKRSHLIPLNEKALDEGINFIRNLSTK